jgi:hypothetical protein
MALIDFYIQWTSALSVFEISGSEGEGRKMKTTAAGVINWEEVKLQGGEGFQEMEPKAIVQRAYVESSHREVLLATAQEIFAQ